MEAAEGADHTENASVEGEERSEGGCEGIRQTDRTRERERVCQTEVSV